MQTEPQPVRPSTRLLKFFLRLEDSLLIGLLLVMVGVAILQILLRNLVDSGIVWGDVLVRMLVLWIGMVGAMVASRKGDHIAIDVITRLLPERYTYLANCLTQFATACVCLITAWFGLKLVRFEYLDGLTAFAGVPVWVCEAIIPIGFTVIALRYLLLCYINLFKAVRPAS